MGRQTVPKVPLKTHFSLGTIWEGGLTVLATVFFVFTNYRINLEMKISFRPKPNITLAFWYSMEQLAQFR